MLRRSKLMRIHHPESKGKYEGVSLIHYCLLYDFTWGIAGPGLQAGQKVDVVRKDGEVRQETVGEIVKNVRGRIFARVISNAHLRRATSPRAAQPDCGINRKGK